MAKVIIGGKEYTIPELNFVALERAWPFIEESMMTLDPMKGASTGINIIAAGLVEDPDFKAERYLIEPDEGLTDDETFHRVVLFLKRQLKSSEIRNIAPCIDQIIQEGGLEPEEGEPLPASQDPSMETAPASSSSSSPQESRVGAGVE